MKTDCDEIKLSNDVISSMGPMQVVADGTGFKGQPDENGKVKKGDLKAIVGVNTAGDVFPLDRGQIHHGKRSMSLGKIIK